MELEGVEERQSEVTNQLGESHIFEIQKKKDVLNPHFSSPIHPSTSPTPFRWHY